MDEEPDETVLAELPDGLRVVSALVTDERPPRHVYRTIGAEGEVLREYSRLVELMEDIDDQDLLPRTSVRATRPETAADGATPPAQ